MLLYGLEGIDSVAKALAHLVPVLIQHKAVRDDSLEAVRPSYHRGDGMKREEPSSCLVYPLGDEVCWEGTTTIKKFLILEGVV